MIDNIGCCQGMRIQGSYQDMEGQETSTLVSAKRALLELGNQPSPLLVMTTKPAPTAIFLVNPINMTEKMRPHHEKQVLLTSNFVIFQFLL
ncbi:unnamed protein product [Caenorhabditis angaria]|uniref:Uncharacterized protein n=1 Tax=Caenorhabditis angaria TaxID=860376 RepID=A0A9P1MUQ8_9PELO|nr:unnamed protein product [Caenorhabditis angaria]CAI5441280.1 unnamed protein product [Caenorhabditis angaria]